MVARTGLWICGETVVRLVSLRDDGTTAVAWEWDARSAPDLDDDRRAWFQDLDEVKPVAFAGAACVLLTASYGGGVALVRREDRALLFSASAVNAHSADLLPGGAVAVAASSGCDRLLVFDLADGPRARRARDRFALPHGHGCVFEPAASRLWVSGAEAVHAYRWRDGGLVHERELGLPTSGAHDLVPDPMRGDLLITTEASVHRLDPGTGAITAFAPLAGVRDVKSLGIDARSGALAWTLWDESVLLLGGDGARRALCFPGHRVYKARWDQSCALAAPSASADLGDGRG